MTLKEKYNANREFISKLLIYCDNHICKEYETSDLPKCDLITCEYRSGEISFDDFKKVMEYKPPVDWSKVPVDTKIYVKNLKNELWKKRHFSHCTPDGKVHAFRYGTTSFTADEGTLRWEYAKLAEKEDDK